MQQGVFYSREPRVTPAAGAGQGGKQVRGAANFNPFLFGHKEKEHQGKAWMKN